LPAPFDITRRILHRDAHDRAEQAGRHCRACRLGPQRWLDRTFGALRFGLDRDPALAHRLDKDTSGCLVLGRTARRWPASASCSSAALSARPTGPSSPACPPSRRRDRPAAGPPQRMTAQLDHEGGGAGDAPPPKPRSPIIAC
jgi:hypothetical protein